MLSLSTTADAVPMRARFSLGACLLSGCAVTPISHFKQDAALAKASAKPGAAGFALPKARAEVVLFSSGSPAAGQAELARQQRISDVNYAHTTRIAAPMGGGTWGPHPARDPV